MPPPANFKLIRAGRLIDGLGSPPIDSAAVLIEGSRIRAVGAKSDIAAPSGASVEVFDYPNKTVLPGMVDAHTHHNGFGDGRFGDDLAQLPDEVLTLQSARNARACLFTGVTSIRENGPKNATTLRLRDAISNGITVGPRMVLCGQPVAIVGGHMWYMGVEATGPNETLAQTRRLIKEGADYIKITATGGSTRTSFPLLPSFNLDELTAITGEAHKLGKLTAAHCVSTQGTVNALDAGVDMIIHCVFKEADGTDSFRKDVADRIIEQGTFVNPTLHVLRVRAWDLEEKRQRQGLTTAEGQLLDEHRRDFDIRLEHCRRLIEMGAKVVTGSDSSWGDYMLGNTPYETECLVMAGYSPMQGVVSVTSLSAASLDINGDVGALEPGKVADIIAVDGDPSEDISALWNVADVFSSGQRVDRGSPESLAPLRQHPPGS